MYLWKAPNRLIERFIPFFLNHAFIKALRHTQRPSVKGFVPYLVKLPVPLVPLEKIPVPALHLPKLHKELFRHFQLVGFALPVLKADKIPCAAFRGFLPKRVCLNPVCHPVVLLQKMSEGISIPHPVARRMAGCFRSYRIILDLPKRAFSNSVSSRPVFTRRLPVRVLSLFVSKVMTVRLREAQS